MEKHFGLSMAGGSSGVSPAAGLAQYLEQPAAEETWRAIQARAQTNTDFYNGSFDFIPQDISQVQPRKTPDMTGYPDGFPTSTWPTWAYRDLENIAHGGALMEPMPHEERFWRSNTLADVKTFSPPVGVQGFICALPVNWTRGENNDSGINLSILAQTQKRPERDRVLAQTDDGRKEETRRI